MSKDKKSKKSKSYLVGPFKDVLDRIDTFAINMYFSYYCDTTIEDILNLHEVYKIDVEGLEEKMKEEDEAIYQQLLEVMTSLAITQEETH